MGKEEISQTIIEMAQAAQAAARQLRVLPTATKNRILAHTAAGLLEKREQVQAENKKDLLAGEEKGLSAAMLDRLTLSDKVIDSMVQGLREVIALDDPVGEVAALKQQASGIRVGKMRVPLGVVGMIYESRPNVTIDAAALCLKSGNSVILRGGSEAIHSNLVLATLLQDALAAEAVNPAAVQVIPMVDREAVNCLLQQEAYLDLIIPRGGEGLIRFVAENSRIPVLKHYKGVCHTYVDEAADLEMAIELIANSKTHRPGVCNALEGVLVHEERAAEFLPRLSARLWDLGVELRGCPVACRWVPGMVPAEADDWGQEFLDLILVIKVVEDFEAAVTYIEQYGSQHTETIVTDSYATGQRFLREVDASAVMINASTRFNDGGQFGLGTEIGISTSKLHAYGPMGLTELTTQKFIVLGEGEIRA